MKYRWAWNGMYIKLQFNTNILQWLHCSKWLFYQYDAFKCKASGKSATNTMHGQVSSLLVYIHSGEKQGLTGK